MYGILASLIIWLRFARSTVTRFRTSSAAGGIRFDKRSICASLVIGRSGRGPLDRTDELQNTLIKRRRQLDERRAGRT